MYTILWSDGSDCGGGRWLLTIMPKYGARGNNNIILCAHVNSVFPHRAAASRYSFVCVRSMHRAAESIRQNRKRLATLNIYRNNIHKYFVCEKKKRHAERNKNNIIRMLSRHTISIGCERER